MIVISLTGSKRCIKVVENNLQKQQNHHLTQIITTDSIELLPSPLSDPNKAAESRGIVLRFLKT
jgi:hypothetical protein